MRNEARIAGLMSKVLKELGEDPKREGLLKTPSRVAKSLRELTSGYAVDVDAMINGALFTESYNEMVLVKDITFYSMCEHHLLPFFGKAHVAYIPDKKIVGLSKIPKLVKIYAKRLQVQERLTSQIAETLQRKLTPLGVGVVLKPATCAWMRGPKAYVADGDQLDAGLLPKDQAPQRF